MNRIKTLIVDDESLARKRIKKLIENDDEIHLVNEFELGSDAISFVENHHIDLIFLDIHMPEINGFQVLQELPQENRPFIIFATADNESALKAFEYKALDYLLKPFRNKRFYEALENAKDYIKLKQKANLSDKLVTILGEYQNPKRSKTQLDEHIDFDDVIYIKSDGNYVKIYFSKSEFQHIRKTMNEIVDQLNSNEFLRVHRSLLVNTYFIEKIEYIGNNEYELFFPENISLKSSRSFKPIIETYLSVNKTN